MVAAPMRRYDDASSSNQPILQFIAMTIPCFVLLVWFLGNTKRRPLSECYDSDNQMTDEARSEACGKLIPLKQFVMVYLAVDFAWMLLALYLSFYVPRRRNLIEAYLSHGEALIGDVYYKEPKREIVTLTSYGHVVYHLPDSTMIRRKVVVFERYTRERVAILCLPGYPCSGQPRSDLEIDRDVIERNRNRIRVLSCYSWAWVAFCTIAPMYIVKVLKPFDLVEEGRKWQPDANEGSFIKWFYIAAFAIIPGVTWVSNWVAWLYYRHWMTSQHQILREDHVQSSGTRGCCFDDDDCETIDIATYIPPSANGKQFETQRSFVAR